MRQRQRPSMSWSMRAVLMGVGFFLVLWMAWFVRDPRVVGAIESFLGPDPGPRWCPEGVSAARIGTGGDLRGRALERFCRARLDTFDQDSLREAGWRPLVHLSAPEGELILEGDPTRALFRIRDFPFSSMDLRERLESLTGP